MTMGITLYRRLLITGSNGVLGTAFKTVQAEFPGREFIFSRSKVCDLTDAAATQAYVGAVKPNAILHLAARSGGIGFSTKYPATLLRDNVLMSFNVLEAARTHRVLKTVMTLSTGMYPSKVPNPILEEYIHDGSPHESVYSYAFAKRLIEPAIRAYRTEYKLSVIGLVPNGIFGENCNFSEEAATMVPSLIRRFYENREGNGKITIWGDGSPLREYTYALDLARAYMWCLDHYDEPQILHVGSMEEVSVRDVAYMIAELLGIDQSRIEFDVSKPSGQPRKHTDNSKFTRLSQFCYTPFQEGLKRTVEWFCEHYEQKVGIRL